SKDSTSQNIIINGQGGPTASIGSSSNVLCNGGSNGSATVTVSGGSSPYTYSWSPSGGSASSASGLSAGTYTVFVTDLNGCVGIDTITITEPLAMAINISAVQTSCGVPDGTATATISGGTPSYTYLWSNGQITQTATGLAAGTYTVTITDFNGCTQTDTALVNSSNGPVATLAQNNVLCNGLCTGTALANSSGGTAPYSYLWSNGATTQNIFNLCAGSYIFTVTDSAGCIDSQTVNITQPPLINVTSSSVPANCGSANGTATATPSGGTPGYTYNWSNGQIAQTVTGLAAGTYFVMVTDTNGCIQTQIVTITTTGGPTATATASITVITPGQNSILTATGGGTYLWNTGQTTSSIIVSPIVDTEYCVTVSDTSQCIDTACVKIFVETKSPCPTNTDLSVPNAFSPNNDGNNDDFCLEGWNACVKDFIVYIYDRWGEKVFESADPAFCWDGTYNGKPMDAAVFVYYIRAELITNEEVIRKGNISLIR
ncbi:MAG: gliding motility-associated C-terminal domain-containing protein, partial [Bacteroidia bacterium]|nr:gliding motility-associated C-terminal domain-containing protein [Bacteroidia bacterium]